MTGQRADGRFGRGRVGPLQALTPVRLPGGVWGPPPATGTVSFDFQGSPSGGFGAVPASVVSSSTARAEWPMPVRWEAQLFLSIERISWASNIIPPQTAPPPVWPIPPNNPAAFSVNGLLQWRVESAQANLPVQLPLGPGLYPFLPAVQGAPGLGATFALVAQQVEFSITSVSGIGDPSLAGSTWQWSASLLLGLTSAGWPSQ